MVKPIVRYRDILIDLEYDNRYDYYENSKYYYTDRCLFIFRDNIDVYNRENGYLIKTYHSRNLVEMMQNGRYIIWYNLSDKATIYIFDCFSLKEKKLLERKSDLEYITMFGDDLFIKFKKDTVDKESLQRDTTHRINLRIISG